MLDENEIECVGSISLMFAGRDLIHADRAVRESSVDYLKSCITMVKELRGSDGGTMTHRALRGRQGEGDGLARGGVGAGPSRACKAVREHASAEGVRDRDRAAQPLRDELRQPPRSGLLLAQEVGDDVGVCLDVYHMNQEEADILQAFATPATGSSTCTSQTTTAWRAGRAARLGARSSGRSKEIGYDGPITVEFVPPLDRTPANPYKNAMAAADDVADRPSSSSSSRTTAPACSRRSSTRGSWRSRSRPCARHM